MPRWSNWRSCCLLTSSNRRSRTLTIATSSSGSRTSSGREGTGPKAHGSWLTALSSAPALDLRFPAANTVSPDLVSVTLDDLSPSAIHETEIEGRPSWRVFFTTPDLRERASAVLHAAHAKAGLEIASVDVPDEDWAARSQASLRAVRVGRVIVAPPWDRRDPDADDVVVIIRPSMGFGTGHHETTRLCLGMLQDLALDDRTVLDVGTGSGVLALTADRLGAASTRGIDLDPDAIDNARENWSLNGRSPRVRFEVADVSDPGAPADIVVANLTGGLLSRMARQLMGLVRRAADRRLGLSDARSGERAGRLRSRGAPMFVEHAKAIGRLRCCTRQAACRP